MNTLLLVVLCHVISSTTAAPEDLMRKLPPSKKLRCFVSDKSHALCSCGLSGMVVLLPLSDSHYFSCPPKPMLFVFGALLDY
mmetsp:Transcript_7239/g.14859  ORF Transcript_7239/g.14859 Transcript_7239/m.14859 type:complete len:82 (+) Transcript_7239:22-267(+)